MARRKRPKIGRTGCLFWIFILLVIAVIFVYRGKGSIKETIALVRKNLLGREALMEAPEREPIIIEENGKIVKVEESVQKQQQEKKDVVGPKQDDSLPESMQPDRSDTAKSTHPPQAEEKRETRAPRQEKKTKSKRLAATIYFIKIDQTSGRARPISITRSIEYIDSPITRTLNTLLKGPTDEEIKQGITSFIPEGTKLISARLKDGHLTLNFTRNFEENYGGRDAILFELSQIMLTAFDFEQVARLNILIEGRKKEYITGEGIPLKEVYTKHDIPLPGLEG